MTKNEETFEGTKITPSNINAKKKEFVHSSNYQRGRSLEGGSLG
jgi:hypothetical protein